MTIWRKGFVKDWVLSLEWKTEGVIDGESEGGKRKWWDDRGPMHRMRCRPRQHGSQRKTPPKFWPKLSWPTRCWFEPRRHSMANCGRVVRDCPMITMASLWETNIALWNGTIDDPLRSIPSPKMVVPNAPLSWYVEFRMAISPQRVIRSTSCLVLG